MHHDLFSISMSARCSTHMTFLKDSDFTAATAHAGHARSERRSTGAGARMVQEHAAAGQQEVMRRRLDNKDAPLSLLSGSFRMLRADASPRRRNDWTHQKQLWCV